MFVPADRDRVRARLLELAADDPLITGAAIIGSHASGAADRWSDIDLAFAVDGPLEPAMARWTTLLYNDFAAIHDWDLPAGSSIYRVFLLPGWLEIDIGFKPAAAFAPNGPHWQTVFGATQPDQPAPMPSPSNLIGLAWHHALQTRVCIARGRLWQAEYWLSSLRDQVLALACLRLGHHTGFAKGVHLLPAEVTTPLEAALVKSLDPTELSRALSAAIAAYAAQLDCADPHLAARLNPMLAELR